MNTCSSSRSATANQSSKACMIIQNDKQQQQKPYRTRSGRLCTPVKEKALLAPWEKQLSLLEDDEFDEDYVPSSGSSDESIDELDE